MAVESEVVSQHYLKPIKILKWKIRPGITVSVGSLVFIYDFEEAEQKQQLKFKSPYDGTVCKLIAEEGSVIGPGDPLFEVEKCIHPTVINDMCADCGADLRKNDIDNVASVPMIHTVPELKVSKELAQKIGKADSERLLKDKKLVLLVDLDQTLIHTTNDIIPPNIKDVYHFQLYGPNSPWYHTRLRPGTHQFLSNMYPYFELHICTFGARNYAHRITAILDADQHFFSNRVLSRDECFNATSKTANLKALFPCGDHMVCIIDDREDVWSYASNLIHVKPYHFFKHTGDINAPPGLEKDENDDKEGIDLTIITKKSQLEKDVDEKCDATVQINYNNGEEMLEHLDIEKNNDPEIVSKNENEYLDIDKNNILEIVSKNENNQTDIGIDKNIISEMVSENENKQTGININGAKENSEVEECTKAIENTVEDDVQENNTIIENPIAASNTDKAEDLKENLENNECTIDPLLTVTEVEDSDDYLLYLEDILKRIHRAFYNEYDTMESGEVPDLKKVIPAVKGKVLEGCKMIFSGLVPTHIKLEHSRAYQVAKSLGAEVTPDFEDGSTHLVAVRPGTAKVNAGRRRKDLKIVTPDWLWACAERWEHVDEKIFPLNSKGSRNRHPPPHCSSPEHVPNYAIHNTPTSRKRTPSGRFMDTINPLMSFSSADIADMDKEVEDILDAESESEDDETVQIIPVSSLQKDREESSSSSSGESLTAELPRGYKRSRKEFQEEDEVNDDTKDTDDCISAKFRRGEELDSDLDIGQDTHSDGSVEPPDEIDDGEWNMMGAALEREFLSNS